MQKIAAVFLVVVFVLSLTLGYLATPKLSQGIANRLGNQQLQTNLVETKLLAVDNNGNGIVANFEVEVRPGRGHLYLRSDANSPYIYLDTQNSLRTAYNFALNYANANSSDYDVYYGVGEGIAERVSGGSAGAGITIATITALKGDYLSPDRIITGTVDKEGNIGKVSGILAKAKAAKAAGVKLMVVPKGEKMQQIEDEKCLNQVASDGQIVEKCETTTKNVDVQTEANLTVIEAGTIDEAYKILIEH